MHFCTIVSTMITTLAYDTEYMYCVQEEQQLPTEMQTIITMHTEITHHVQLLDLVIKQEPVKIVCRKIKLTFN